MQELKPCPFCGGEGIVDPHDNDTWCIIKCKECGASTHAFSTIVDATHYWNTRTPKRESVIQALGMLHDMIDGGEECRGRDSEISDIIRLLEQGR